MLKNYVPKTSHIEVDHDIIFYYDDNGGFGFPCDATGNVTLSELSDCAMKNLLWCLENPDKFKHFGEVRTNRKRVHDNAHGTCECGREVYLFNQYMGACECKCGRWYNLFGQELNDPTTWSEGDDW